MQEVIIDIDEVGNVTVDASKSGFDGPECQALTAEIEAALGVVSKVTKTAEFHRVRKIRQTAKR